MTKNGIPSAEELERARAAMRERDRGLSEVCARISKRFTELGLHEVFVFYSPATDTFVVHLFYRTRDLVTEADESGLTSRIEEAVIRELEAVGRGPRDSLTVQLDVDSHENVEASFGGDYFLRLR